MAGRSSDPGTYDAGQVLVRTTVDESEGVSTSVVLALDALPEFDAETSDENLFEHVDPDALDALFRSPREDPHATGVVCFPIADYEVRVSAHGEIVVRGRPH